HDIDDGGIALGFNGEVKAVLAIVGVIDSEPFLAQSFDNKRGGSRVVLDEQYLHGQSLRRMFLARETDGSSTTDTVRLNLIGWEAGKRIRRGVLDPVADL